MTQEYAEGSILNENGEFHICRYFPCYVAKVSGRNCADYENCQTWKFKQRYPDFLGVGSIMDIEHIVSQNSTKEKQ